MTVMFFFVHSTLDVSSSVPCTVLFHAWSWRVSHLPCLHRGLMILSLLPVLSLHLCSYPELKPIQSINAHPSNCICIKFDPMGKYFATGSADALVSLWDVDELVCVRCFSR